MIPYFSVIFKNDKLYWLSNVR